MDDKKYSESLTANSVTSIKMCAIIAAVAIGSGIVSGLIVRKYMVGGLDKTLEEARSMLDNLSGKVDKAVQSVYTTKAKAPFEKRLVSIDSDGIATMARKMVKTNVVEALEKAISRDRRYGCDQGLYIR